jgi:hypothetical protein
MLLRGVEWSDGVPLPDPPLEWIEAVRDSADS